MTPAAAARSSIGAPSAGAVLAARWTQGLIALVVGTGLVLQLVLILVGGTDANSGEGAAAAPPATRLVRLFSYFTIQSNIVVLVVAVLLVLRPLRDGRGWRIARLDSLLGITITGLVFRLVLAPELELTGWPLVASVLLHDISPWLTLGAWLVFGPRPRLSLPVLVGAFGWPVLWLLYTFVRGAFVDWYPYPFLDVTEVGFGRALGSSLLVVAVAVVLAGIVRLLDARLPAVLGGPQDDSAR